AKAMVVAAESAVHETLTPISESLFSIDASGIVKTSLLPGEAFNLEMFTTAGVKVWSEEGNASGNDSFRLPDAEGLIIVRLSAERGSSVIKFLR
ncbi:MAG: hypothetical protein K2J87_04580, partial [Muribaculaceae bacterium]|nr:hypothetical protein [Muribaculaceae bacterium]